MCKVYFSVVTDPIKCTDKENSKFHLNLTGLLSSNLTGVITIVICTSHTPIIQLVFTEMRVRCCGDFLITRMGCVSPCLKVCPLDLWSLFKRTFNVTFQVVDGTWTRNLAWFAIDILNLNSYYLWIDYAYSYQFITTTYPTLLGI